MLGPAADNALEILLLSYSGVTVPARNNNSFTERHQRFESHLLQQRVSRTPHRPIGPGETSKAFPERAGVLRYFVRIGEKIVWADRPEELMEDLLQGQELPPGIDPPLPMSVTFIPATVSDNPALLRVNPEYLAWLLSLPTLERERLLGGNWKIRPAAGLYFKREWCAVVDEAPADLDIVRYWDLAATEKTEFNDPDWTIGVKLGRDRSRGYWLLDVVRARANPGDVEQLLLNIAEQDGKRVTIGFGQDPGRPARARRSIWCGR